MAGTDGLCIDARSRAYLTPVASSGGKGASNAAIHKNILKIDPLGSS